MITRVYRTKEECAELFVKEYFDCIPLDLLEGPYGTYDDWGFHALVDTDEFDPKDPMSTESYDYDPLGEPDDKGRVLVVADPPIWGTIFKPADESVYWSIVRDTRAVAALGFTLVYDTEGHFYALGVDGAGYDFVEAHWMPLYDHFGIHWHDEDEDAAV